MQASQNCIQVRTIILFLKIHRLSPSSLFPYTFATIAQSARVAYRRWFPTIRHLSKQALVYFYIVTMILQERGMWLNLTLWTINRMPIAFILPNYAYYHSLVIFI